MKSLLGVIVLLWLAPGALTAQKRSQADSALRATRQYEKHYTKAIKDAQLIEPKDMVDFLWGVKDDRVSCNEDSLVLVSMLVAESDLGQWTGSPKRVAPASNEPTQMWWVSLDPELGSLLKELPLMDSTQAAHRINQMLGIAPDHFQGFVVNFWVSPDDLFRPCANPDPTTHYSTVTLPEGVNPSHKAWIEAYRRSAYTGTPARLWGQLGYSYDWGNLLFPVGVSEFVVKPESVVITESLSSIWNWYTRYVDINQLPYPVTITTDLPKSDILDQ